MILLVIQLIKNPGRAIRLHQNYTPTGDKAKPDPEALLLEIALKHFPNIETLEIRKSDELDFHDVSIWSIHGALAAAYAAGQVEATR